MSYELSNSTNEQIRFRPTRLKLPLSYATGVLHRFAQTKQNSNDDMSCVISMALGKRQCNEKWVRHRREDAAIDNFQFQGFWQQAETTIYKCTLAEGAAERTKPHPDRLIQVQALEEDDESTAQPCLGPKLASREKRLLIMDCHNWATTDTKGTSQFRNSCVCKS